MVPGLASSHVTAVKLEAWTICWHKAWLCFLMDQLQWCQA